MLPRLTLVPPPDDDADDSDARLMARISQGDRIAFCTFVSRHQNRVSNFCRKSMRNRDAAQEAAQEVFLSLWNSRERIHSSKTPMAYLLTLAVNRCRNHHRAFYRFKEALLQFSKNENHQVHLETRLLNDERQTQVNYALARLPEKLRTAVLLKYDQNLEYSEIADILECPESTVRSRIFLAIQKVKEIVNSHEEELP